MMLVAIFSSDFMLKVSVNWEYKVNFYLQKECQPQQINRGVKIYGLRVKQRAKEDAIGERE